MSEQTQQTQQEEAPKLSLRESIEAAMTKFVNEHAGPEFTFRPGQREAIITIIVTYLEKDKKHYFLQAPTGAGKSMIAICVAFVLNELGYTGYILASDIDLQSQYEDDFARLGLCWGSVKGMRNYCCSENGEQHNFGNCHVRLEDYSVIKERKCFKDCEYYSARNQAAASPTALLNYSYWLLQQNYVNKKPNGMFPARDFIICDEAHKLLDIVQNHFAPQIDKFTEKNIDSLLDIFGRELGIVSYAPKEIHGIINDLKTIKDNAKLAQRISQFEGILEGIKMTADGFRHHVADTYANGNIPNYLRKYIKLCEWVKDIHCKFEDFDNFIDDIGVNMFVACHNEDGVVFKTLDEKYLMESCFHQKHKFSVMMTATMGDPATYYSNIKGFQTDKCRSFGIPSTFDFSKSPIYVYPGMSMSYKNKDANMPKVIEKINEILEKHKDDHGIIHCGSYQLGNNLYDGIEDKERIINYDTGQKSFSLCNFADDGNSVLMGPSILEGINLENERSRFQIFAKIPYASLGDEFVAAKLKYNPEWYQNDAIIKVLQGVGRSVRNEKDWAATYILDSDFINLWKRNKKQFPKEFNDRLVFVY